MFSPKTVATGALALALVGGAWAFFRDENAVLPNDRISNVPGTYYVSATWRGEFKAYKSYVLEIAKKTVDEAVPTEFDEYAKTVSKFSFPEGYIVQEFCENGDRRFVVGGKF